jgi:hypothetical protein
MADASAESLEALMLAESKPLSADYQLELYRWTSAWYDEAVAAGFIRPTLQPDDETVSRLRAYFDSGLSPTEAAQAIFGEKH